eukprot:jgi/Chlat1/6160/Chrsp41S05725
MLKLHLDMYTTFSYGITDNHVQILACNTALSPYFGASTAAGTRTTATTRSTRSSATRPCAVPETAGNR